MSERRVHEASGMGLPCSSRTTVQHGLGTGRSKIYPSNSARTLLKECFTDNPLVHLDPHQQLTGMSSDQMIHIDRAIGSEISLATFGMLEDVLLKIGGKTGRNLGDKGSGQSLLSVGLDSQFLRVFLRVRFILCLLLQNRLIVILL